MAEQKTFHKKLSEKGEKPDDLPGGRFISGKNLYKSFHNNGSSIDVLRGIDFEILKGETIVITGPSGIGKSTLLHILGTLDRPDRGTLYFKGMDVFLKDEIQLARHRNTTIGFIFQFHYLLHEFSAVENVMMPALISNMDKQRAGAIAEEILVRVGLKDRLKHRVNELSGGEQQRVAIARALVLKPSLLLADEPTGNLDKQNSEQIHELLLELNRELFMTMIIVTHNTELASIMSRRITIIDGQLVDA
jgi:lipoprotein-releasing system ATP-binding protein